jgi:hypothetical protein
MNTLDIPKACIMPPSPSDVIVMDTYAVKWAEFFGKKCIVMCVITVTMCLAQSEWDE